MENYSTTMHQLLVVINHLPGNKLNSKLVGYGLVALALLKLDDLRLQVCYGRW